MPSNFVGWLIFGFFVGFGFTGGAYVFNALLALLHLGTTKKPGEAP